MEQNKGGNKRRGQQGNSDFKYQPKNKVAESDASSQDSDYERKTPKAPLSFKNMKEIREIQKRPEVLLNDDQMIKFIKDGYLVLQTDYPESFHKFIYDRAEAMDINRKNNNGNNILPELPFLQDIYDCPTVRGALTSLLGNNYMMHSHRHPHNSPPGFGGQQWHMDSYWGHSKPRSHVPRWVMAMYYPQKTVAQMGPTAIAPSTQYSGLNKTSERHIGKLPADWNSKELLMTCPAGTVVIIHYDLWHKATPNKSETNRYMFKFQFIRMEEPTKPTWDTTRKVDDSYVTPFDNENSPFAPVWAHVWTWLTRGPIGVDSRLDKSSKADDKEIAELASRLRMCDKPEQDPIRLHAAYTLTGHGEKALAALEEAFTENQDHTCRNGMYGLIAFGSKAVPFLKKVLQSNPSPQLKSFAVFALGEIGSVAKQSLSVVSAQLTNSNDYVRRNAAEALGPLSVALSAVDIGEVVKTLLDALSDPDDQVRFQAALSLAQVSPMIQEKRFIQQIVGMLDDSNRYTRTYLLQALTRSNLPEAKDALIRELWVSRWDPLTTKDTQF